MNVIQKVFAEEIFNAQGLPTIQCTIELSNGQIIKSSIPSGFTTPESATPYAYDNNNRLIQQRMQQAIAYINNNIVPLLIKNPVNALLMDSQLMDLHVTQPDDALGSNTTLVVSIALFKAQAASENIQLFQLLQSISGTAQVSIPQPLVSLFELRQPNSLQDIKEIVAFPAHKNTTYQQQLHSMIMLHHHAKKILEIRNLSTNTGLYGSFAPNINNFHEILDVITKTIQTLPEQAYQFGLNIAANDLYDPSTKTYHWNNEAVTSNMLINDYDSLLKAHPHIAYLQDAIASQDSAGWKQLSSQLPLSVYDAADQIFGTNPMKIRWGILQKIANIVVIKPEYISTISQTLAAIDACKNNNKAFLISGDSLGTNDNFISDLAVGTGATFLKAGAPSGSEHMTKYNRLLEIERLLHPEREQH